jgi:hypothetical protein
MFHCVGICYCFTRLLRYLHHSLVVSSPELYFGGPCFDYGFKGRI